MGMGWSVSHHYYIHQHVNVQNTCYQKKLPISLKHGLVQNPFLKLIDLKNPNQYAIITSVVLDSINSECDCPIRITIQNGESFPQSIELYFSPNVMDTSSELLYKHILNPKVITQYAGLESELGAGCDVVPGNSEDECYAPTHPLMSFILNNRAHLKEFEQVGDVAEKKAKNVATDKSRYYVLQREFAEKCRQFFRDTILDKFTYTRFDDAKVELKVERESEHDNPVFMTLVIDYFLVDKEYNDSIKEITEQVE